MGVLGEKELEMRGWEFAQEKRVSVCVGRWLTGWVAGWVCGCVSDAAKSFKLGEGTQECSPAILITVKFLRLKSPRPASLQFHSDWRRSEKKKKAMHRD